MPHTTGVRRSNKICVRLFLIALHVVGESVHGPYQHLDHILDAREHSLRLMFQPVQTVFRASNSTSWTWQTENACVTRPPRSMLFDPDFE